MSTIITRNSATSGSTPSSLVQGELAINVTDGRLFYGSGSGNIVKEFTGSASGGTTIDTGSFVTTSSFNAYTGSNTSQFAGTASYATNALSASYAETASYALTSVTPSLQQVVNTGNSLVNFGGIGTASLLSVNFVNNRSLYLNDDSYPTIRLVDNNNASNNLQIDIDTISLDGVPYNWSDIVNSTASYALQALSASYAETASYAPDYLPLTGGTISGTLYQSGTFYPDQIDWFSSSIGYDTGSYILTTTANGLTTYANYQDVANTLAPYIPTVSSSISASYAETASYAPAYLPLTGGTINGDVIVNGTASIAFLNVSVESASVIYSSGSNQFGDASNDVQTLWGTVDVKTGPVLVTGSLNVSGGITGSLLGTASYAAQALSSSYALTSTSASHAVNANNAISSSYALTASYVQNAQTASFITASNVYGPYGSNSVISASYALNALSASYAITASSALNAQDILIRVLNQSGNSISKGIVVHITASGNSSDIPRVITASYENDSNSANTLGIANETIANGAEGFVMTEGVLKGIDTSTFTSGQLIYLGATGSIIGTAPVAPLHAVRLGQVVREQSNNGSIYVRIDNGYELGELHDVRDTTTTSSYGDLLVKSGSIWINSKQLTGSYGLTGSLTATSFTGSLFGTASYATQALSASYILNAVSASYATQALSSSFALTASYVLQAVSASYAATSSYATQFNVATGLTASGLIYPSADNGNESYIQTDGAGNLSLQYVKSMYETVRNRETSSIISGIPLFVSGATGANSDVYIADASNPARMPATYIASETIAPSGTGKALISGLLTNINTTAYQAGQELFVNTGSGITTSRPPYPNSVQLLGIVTRVGINGQAVILNPGQIEIQNIQPGYTLVGNSIGTPTAVATASLSVASASFATTASYVLNAVSASFATQALSASYATTASYVLQAVSASFATLAQTANTASYVQTAQTASYVLNAISASFATSSSRAVSASFATTASYSNTSTSASYALSASYAPTVNPFPYTGDAQISGSLGVTGSFSLQTFNGLTDVTAISFDGVTRVINDVMGSTSINADDRELYDSSTVLSATWDGRRLVDTVSSQSVNWNDRLLKIDNGPGAFTVNWGGGLLRDTGSNNSVDWQNRIAIDTANKDSINWQNRQLKDTSGNEVLNWQSGVTITGSTFISGSLTLTGSLYITGSATLINEGPTILSGSFKVQGEGTGFSGPFPAIEVDDTNFSRKHMI